MDANLSQQRVMMTLSWRGGVGVEKYHQLALRLVRAA